MQRERIETTLKYLELWANRLPEADIEVKIMDYLPPYSMGIAHPKKSDEMVFCSVRILPFRSYTTKAPVLMPDPVHDKYWFEFFLEQFEKLWAAAERIELNISSISV